MKPAARVQAASNARPCLALLLVFALQLGFAEAVQAQSPTGAGFQGLLADLEAMEQRLQLAADPAAPLTQRLSALEQRLFGAPRPGSMLERMQQLKSAAAQLPAYQMPAARNPSTYTPQAAASAWPPEQGPPPLPLPNSANAAAPNNAAPGIAAPGIAAPGIAAPGIAAPGAGQYPPQVAANSAAGWFPPQAPGFGPQAGARSPAGSWYPPQAADAKAEAPGTNPGGAWYPPQAAGAPPRPVLAPNASPGNGWFPAAGVNRAAISRPAASTPAAASPPIEAGSNLIPLQSGKTAEMPKNFEPDALPLQNAFPPNLLRMEPDNTALSARPDYFSEVHKASKGKTIRFTNMPVPVYIQPYVDRGYINCVLRSFENWEFRTNGTVRFQQVSNSNQARIQVVWKHLGGKKDGSDCLLGAHTILKYTSRGNGNLSFVSVGAVPVPVYVPRVGPKYTVPPQVMEVNLDLINSKEPSIKYLCLQNIVTHELGHALGLLGHSPSQADIMYPITDEYSRLSQRDLNTLYKLYNQKCDLPL